MCFLEREVYAFLSGFAAQCRGPAFFLFMGRPQNDVRGRRWTGRRWVAGSTREWLRAEQHKRSDTREMRERRGRVVFSFLGEKIRRCFLCLPGGSSRSAAIAALEYRHREIACAQLRHGRKTQLVEDCGPWPFQLIQLIYLRYLCGSAEREERMDVCFLLTLYI